MVHYPSELVYDNKNIKYFLKFAKNMADASMAAFGAVVGVVIILAMVYFVIHGKVHHDNISYTVRRQA